MTAESMTTIVGISGSLQNVTCESLGRQISFSFTCDLSYLSRDINFGLTKFKLGTHVYGTRRITCVKFCDTRNYNGHVTAVSMATIFDNGLESNNFLET